jgi:hypothetical protein
MTTRELLELAQIDALGLLDELEREEFDRAMMIAPPPVQAQIRAAQDRFVKTSWMPEPVEPPSSLRDAVMSDIGAQTMKPRIMAAIREEIRRSTREIAIQAVAPVRHASGRNVPEISKVRRGSPWWRAAALGRLGASVVFGYTTISVFEQVETLDKIAKEDHTAANLVQAPGVPLFDLIFDPQTRRLIMAPEAADVDGQATVMVTPEASTADGSRVLLLCSKLAQVAGMEYRVVATDHVGLSKVVDRFDEVTGLKGRELKDVIPAKCAKLAIVLVPKNTTDDVLGSVLLSVGPLLG